MSQNILLVEPKFPIPPKSKNHKNFLPIGLLKLASYHREKGDRIKLIRGNKTKLEIGRSGDGNWQVPDKILVTSLFTYWTTYVRDCVQHYKKIYCDVPITVGGIYASLLPDHCKRYTGCDEVYEGVHEKAEKCPPAYDLLQKNPHPIDYQIIHTTRGCQRKCVFCGSWKIEPDFKAKKSIKNEIKYKKIVFYDNNFLANPHIDKILKELIELKKQKKIIWCEAQSGFDGKILKKKPYLAKMLKKAGFRYLRIAWDWGYENYHEIKEQLDILFDVGNRSKDIFVFMLYNWDIPFEEMEKKRIQCWDWKVQITDCRYRPLEQTYENYNPRKTEQLNGNYYIHNKSGWTDKLIRAFRANVRRQNICVRQDINYYSTDMERKRIPKDLTIKYKKLSYEQCGNVKKYLKDAWNPAEIHYPETK